MFPSLNLTFMKFFTSAIAFLLATFVLSAQVVLVNSPSNLAGTYNFSAAGFGRVLTDSVWTGDVVFVNDGSATPTRGCQALTNGSEVAGKIALIDRGTCEFGLKCLNAQNAGAIAVIVFNNAAGAGTIVMGPGVNGGNVTIPCVMLSLEDGQLIRNALLTGNVNVTIGNVRFPNNVRSNARAGIAHAPKGAIPGHQIDAAGVFSVIPGARVENVGLNSASNVTVAATISHSQAGQVYSQSASVAAVDSDSSSLVVLPEFDPFASGEGTYTINYTISTDSTDAQPADNSFSSEFAVTEDAYCNGGWDNVARRATITNAYTISGGGNIEFLTPIYVNKGAGFKMDSVVFYVSRPAGSPMSEITVNAFLYSWNDLDGDQAIENAELDVVALVDEAPYETPDAATSWVRAPLLDINDFEEGHILPGDDLVYFLGIRYEGDQLVYIGFDENQDFTQYLDILGANTTDLDLPYIGTNTFQSSGLPSIEDGFLFTGFRGAVATGLIWSPIASSTPDILTEDQLTMNVFPNPVSNVLTANLTLDAPAQKVSYRITDMNGRTLQQLRKQQIQEDRVDFNVATLPVGQYYLVVSTENGFARRAFTVQR